MLVNKFKELAESLNWVFNYGNLEFQNLLDLPVNIDVETDEGTEEVTATYFLLLWSDEDPEFDEFNNVISETFEGQFVLAERSEITEKDFNYKYETHIRKMRGKVKSFMALISACDKWHISKFKNTVVSDALDANVDGIQVSFRVRYDY